MLEAGPRVFLRPPGPRDARGLAGLARASRRLHHPWVYPPTTTPAVTRWLGAAGPTRHRLLVCRRSDGAILGVVNVSEIVRAALQSAYLGYYAFGPHAGHGYMAEGLALVLRFAFRHLRLHRLEANIQPANRSSRRLVRRLGFRKEGFSPRYLKVGGRWRDHERWAIVREAWKQEPAASGRGRGVRRAGRARVRRPSREPA
ncbi:MAG TPA: GNAT family protein [Methylomirabilota bacterium]